MRQSTAPQSMQTGNSNPGNVEIYKQKYDTFRHFDRIRWQLIQMAIVSSAAIIALETNDPHAFYPSLFSRVITGFILIFFSVVIMQLNTITHANSKALKEVAERLGDTSIPETTKSWRRATISISIAFGIFGLISVSSIFLDIMNGN